MKTYTIKKGDTLGKIAKRFYGNLSKYKIIAEVNNISNPDKIKVGQRIKIPDVTGITIKSNSNNSGIDFASLKKYHSAFPDGIKWRLVEDGVEILGSGVERTKGKPTTVTKIWENRNKEINKWANEFQVPCELIIATIATESGNNEKARREEPGFISDVKTPHRVSVGLMQTLLSTAASVLGKEKVTSKWLEKPSNSIQAGTGYIAQQGKKTILDPPKVACAYNAGGIYHNQGEKNRWKMRQYPLGTSHHCDRFIKWYNDAVYMLEKHDIKSLFSHKDILLYKNL
jgi:LysM repeat protein